MEIIELRELIQAKIEHSDKKVLEAIYELLQGAHENHFAVTDEEINEIESETLAYLSGKTKGYTLEEVKANCTLSNGL